MVMVFKNGHVLIYKLTVYKNYSKNVYVYDDIAIFLLMKLRVLVILHSIVNFRVIMINFIQY